MPSWSYLYVASEWTIRLVMLVYVPQQRSAAASRTWLLLIFLLPWPGLAIYALLGRIRVPRERIDQQKKASQRIMDAQTHLLPRVVCRPPLPDYLAHIPKLAAKLGDFDVFGGNAVELLPDYEGSIDRLINDIDGAQNHVHLLTYIFAPDTTGERLAAALGRAAKRGVHTRLMADAVGSRPGWPGSPRNSGATAWRWCRCCPWDSSATTRRASICAIIASWPSSTVSWAMRARRIS